MRKFLFPGLVGLLLLILAACGSSATAVPAAKQAPAAPAAAAQPAAQPAAPAAAAQAAAPAAAAAKAAPGAVTLADAAAKLAGKPGAVYIGDLKQLVGPAPTKELGDSDGNVSLPVLQGGKWVFETDYYKSLVEKANLTKPTQLVTSGQKTKLQYVCINRTLDPCKLIEVFLAPNVLKRTNGQVEITISSYPELGIAGPDALDLVKEGSLGFGQIQPAFVGGTLPIIDIIYLWGLWSDHAAEHTANTKAVPILDAKVSEKTGGGKVVFHVWYGGNDLYFFSKKPLAKPEDFKGVKIRSHGTTMSDYINALGGEAQFVAFAEVYTALERGILGAGNSGGKAGWGQRWYEVTKYLSGPIISLPMGYETMNKGLWDRFPADIQQILIEEGARQELENLRLSPTWLDSAVKVNLDQGMKLVPYSDEMNQYIFENVTLGRVMPSWIKRVGGPSSEAVKLYNDVYAPLSGVKIEVNGALTKIGGQKAPAVPSAGAGPAPTALAAYAVEHAGKPGAIYVGDLKQLVGPALAKDLGDKLGGVTLDSLSRHSWLFDTPYYQTLLKKAKLENPTPLTTKGKSFKAQYSCINRALQWCKLLQGFFAANVLKRTEGQMEISISSYPELGLGGTDNLRLVADGTLGMTEIYGGFVAGDLPIIELQYLWGLYTEDKTHYLATNAVLDDLDRLIAEKAGGAKVILHNWATGVSQFFFTKKPIRTVEDFKGLKTRSHGTALSDWIIGMGAVPQFVPFAETYTALERGILDAGVTGADPAFGQRWQEVTDYMSGPLTTFTSTNVIMNKKVWEGLPADIQAILLEEGAKNELEGLRVSPAWNDTGVPKLVDAGLKVIPFSPELVARSYQVSLERVIPNWVKRIGGPGSEAAKIFNEKIGPLVNVRINQDGSASKTTK